MLSCNSNLAELLTGLSFYMYPLSTYLPLSRSYLHKWFPLYIYISVIQKSTVIEFLITIQCTTNSKINEKALLLLCYRIVLVSWCLGDLVKPTYICLASQIGHPRGWDSSFKHCLPVHPSEPLVILDRCTILC